MTQGASEPPLQQKGAAERAEYEARLRRSVVEKQNPAITDFGKWLSRQKLSVKDLLKPA